MDLFRDLQGVGFGVDPRLSAHSMRHGHVCHQQPALGPVHDQLFEVEFEPVAHSSQYRLRLLLPDLGHPPPLQDDLNTSLFTSF